MNRSDLSRGASQASQAYQNYLAVHKTGAKGLNLKDWGRILGWVCMVGSLIFWIPMEWSMAQPIDSPAAALIAVAFGVYVAVGSPVIVSIFLPGTRAGRLLLKLNIATPGKVAGLGAGGFLMWHAFRLLYYWWLGRAAGVAGMATEYAILGVIFTIISPALFYEGQSQAELRQQLQDEHEIAVYEQTTAARVNLALKARQNAEGLMARGLENLSDKESAVVAGYLRQFVQAVDQTHAEWQRQIKQATGVVVPYGQLGGDQRTAQLFDFLGNLAEVGTVDVPATRQLLDQHVTAQIEAGRPAQGLTLKLPPPVGTPAAPQVIEQVAASTPVLSAQDAEGESWNSFQLFYEQFHKAQPFVRADVELVLQVKRSKAGAVLADWKTRGWVAEVPEIRHHYSFTIGTGAEAE